MLLPNLTVSSLFPSNMSSYLGLQSLVYPGQFNNDGATSTHTDGYPDRYSSYTGAEAWVGGPGDVGAAAASALDYYADSQRSPIDDGQPRRETPVPQDYRLQQQQDFRAFPMTRDSPAPAHVSGNNGGAYGATSNNIHHIQHQHHHHHQDHHSKRHNKYSPYMREHHQQAKQSHAQPLQKLATPKQEPVSSGPTSPLLLQQPRQSTPIANEATSPTTGNRTSNSSSSSRASEFTQQSPISPLALDARGESPDELLSGNETGSNTNGQLSPVHSGNSGTALGTSGKLCSGEADVNGDASPPRTQIYPWMRRNHVGTGKLSNAYSII